ncbi:hypothetical protein NOU13_25860 [Rhodococcus erythropolis]|nr:hypothetical protein [Rhodococcus erythropolis]MCQ4127932.1 hypothetical protein [Rhodococcus erythropolis]
MSVSTSVAMPDGWTKVDLGPDPVYRVRNGRRVRVVDEWILGDN